MEITKVFSELTSGERLYSVLMSEEEIMMFSKKKSEMSEGLGHLAGAGINGIIARSLHKNALKSKSKLSAVGGALATGNSAYHAYKGASKIMKS